LLYAWNRLDTGDVVEAGAERLDSQVDLFARLIEAEFNRLVRRGLDRGYVPYEAAIAGVRGRIDVGATMRHQLLAQGRTQCRFDELSWDVTLNRIILATVKALLDVRSLSPLLYDRLTTVARRLSDVSSIRLTADVFRSVQLHRNNASYAHVLRLCRFIFDNAMPNETTGTLFRDFIRDEKQMPLVFQDFVRNFYALEQERFDVRPRSFRWRGRALTPESDAYLPMLSTDMVLESRTRTIIIDTKYTPEAFRTWHVQPKLRSEHLYQLFAYLENYPATRGTDTRLEGMLLYPGVHGSFEHAYEIHGRLLRVCAVDLSRPWREVHAQLLTFIADGYSQLGGAHGDFS
jgi:5-methylcytosine-specific restriction enzyme subunit McrC